MSHLYRPVVLLSLRLATAVFLACSASSAAEPNSVARKAEPSATKPATKADSKADSKPDPATPSKTPEVAPATEEPGLSDEAAAEDAEAAVVALPVNPEPVRVYGWREDVLVDGVKGKLLAKLDTGALTSSIHAEEKELFERDGKKWVRFIVTDPRDKNSVRTRLEAPLVRVARIKEPNAESTTREVVRLSFQIGERKLRGEFTLNNRNNMLAPVLLGRSTLKDLGWVDPGRIHLADQKILR